MQQISITPKITREYAIDGMTCSACRGTVSSILQKLSFVLEANVSILTHRALLTILPTSEDVDDKVIGTLEKSGFGGSLVQQPAEVNDPAPNEDPEDCNSRSESDVVVQYGTIYLSFDKNEDAESAQARLRASDSVSSAEIMSSRRPTRHGSASCFRKDKAMPTAICIRTSEKLSVPPILTASPKLEYKIIAPTDPLITGDTPASEELQRQALVYRRRFIYALILAIPVAFVTMLFSRVDAFGAEALKSHIGDSAIRIVDLIAFILTTPIQFWAARGFYRSAWYAMKKCRPNMDVLIVVGTTIAYLYSILIPIINSFRKARGEQLAHEHTAFETSALLITIVLFGKWIESNGKRKTASGVEALMSLSPPMANLVTAPPDVSERFEESINVQLVSPGDFFRVPPGGAFPLDGKMAMGQTTVDESMLTGESWPVPKTVGDDVYAGTMNGGNAVVVQCTKSADSSMLESIVRVVKRGQQLRAPVEAFADRVSAFFVPVVVFIAVIVTIVWYVLAATNSIPADWTDREGDVLFALLFGLSVVVIACPCALGLATPTVVMMATNIGARKLGVLFREGGKALQAANEAGTVLFDKTGTLTVGKPGLTGVQGFEIDQSGTITVSSRHELLVDEWRKICKTEEFSEHPIGRALISHADEIAIPSGGSRVVENHSVQGTGIWCKFADDTIVVIGKPKWVTVPDDWELPRTDEISRQFPSLRTSADVGHIIDDWEHEGRTVVMGYITEMSKIGRERGRVFLFGVEDAIQPDAAMVVKYFKERDFVVGMVTGDGEGTALSVARRVGIPKAYVHARALPQDKEAHVRNYLRSGGEKKKKGVIFIGDGINDSPPLSVATLGIALSSGSQIAAETAGVVLVNSNLSGIIDTIDLSRHAFRKIRWNYMWALLFNCIGIPLAGGAVYPFWQLRIPPYAAAVAMAASSIAVVVNSLWLANYKRLDLGPEMESAAKVEKVDEE